MSRLECLLAELSDGDLDRLTELLASRLLARLAVSPKSRGLCAVEGCDRPHRARGLCKTHYQRMRYATDPDWRARRRESQKREAATERARERAREWARKRYATDSEYRADRNARRAMYKGFERAMGL